MARQLAPHAEGRLLAALSISDPLIDLASDADASGRAVLSLKRIGKQVVFELGPSPADDSPLWIGIHLRMTGRLVHARDEFTGQDRPPRAVFELDQGRIGFFDTRRFGTIRLHRELKALDPPGLDPTHDVFTARRLKELIGKSKQEMKVWLLRQDRLTGLGNIYCSEILFASGVDPRRPACELTDDEIKRVHRHTKRILNKAIKACGTTFSDFQDAHGLTGSYQKYLKVYKKEGLPCPTCGTPISRIVQAQRSTFYCPVCQPGDS